MATRPEGRRGGEVLHIADLRAARARRQGRAARARGAALRLVGRRRERASDDARARIWLSVARAASVAVAGAFVVGTGRPEQLGFIAIAAAQTLLAATGRGGRIFTAFDVLVTAGLLGATGGTASHLVPYALVAAVAAGYRLGPLAGTVAGGVIVASTAPLIVRAVGAGTLEPYLAVNWFALFPLSAMAGGMAARIAVGPASRLLADANRGLAGVYRLARSMPSGLEMGRVASEALEEVARTLDASAAALLQADGGTTHVVGSYGVERPELLAAAAAPLLRGTRARAVQIDGRCWLVAPVSRGSRVLAVILSSCERHNHARDLELLADLAADAAVPVENAVLFRRIRELSVDEERQRIARDLHDSVAQALTHLRLELDFVARSADLSEDMRENVHRMSRVAERAAVEVRDAIRGLRGGLEGGVAGALRNHLADLRGRGAPQVVLDADDSVRLPPAIEQETFRIAQEAISNAIRHARARNVLVSLRRDEAEVRLVVEDDGRGIPLDRRDGVGLLAMQERADRIGARLAIEGEARGTRVALNVPLRIRRTP